MSVRLRLIRSTAFIALAAVLVLGIPLILVETARVGTDQAYRLEREADVVAGVIDDRVEAGQRVTVAQLAPHVVPGHRVTAVVGGRAVVAGARLGGEVRTVRASSARNAVVLASAPRAEESRRVRRVQELIALLGVGGLALAVGLAVLQARRISRPLEGLARTSAQLGDGDFSVRAPPSDIPEIDAIGRALDGSAERIARLVAREREFSANVSHQMRTPLTALRLRLEELLLQGRADHAEEARAALREADRLEATIAGLLSYAREERAGRAVRLDLPRIAADHVRSWRPLLARKGRALTVRVDGAIPALASRGMVGQVLDVLLENALRHGAGEVVVRVGSDAGRALLTVEDAGSGIAPADRERVFERGASTGGGTGIGLHLARSLAEADGASLRIARRDEHPSRLELRIPPAGGAGPPSRPAGAAGPSAGEGAVVTTRR